MAKSYFILKALIVISISSGLLAPTVQARVSPNLFSEDGKLAPMVTEQPDKNTRSMQSANLPDSGAAASLQHQDLVELEHGLQKLARVIGPDKDDLREEFPWPLPIAP